MTPYTVVVETFNWFVNIIAEAFVRLFNFNFIDVPYPYWFVWSALVFGVIAVVKAIAFDGGKEGHGGKDK